jgi:hypothetical protein
MAREILLSLVLLSVYGLFDNPELVTQITWDQQPALVEDPDYLVVIILYDRTSELCIEFEDAYHDFVVE